MSRWVRRGRGDPGSMPSDDEDLVVEFSETDRVETFSDGVFAIAITLLVLDVRPPQHRPGDLVGALLRQWPAYLGYITSFVYIAVIWLNHHAAFKRIRYIDRRLHIANLAVLCTTALLPFPTAVLSSTLQASNVVDQRGAVALYALVAALMCASWTVFFHVLTVRPELAEEDVAEGFFREDRMRGIIGVVLYAVAGALGYLVAPPLALVVFLALPNFYGATADGFVVFKASWTPVECRAGHLA
jgi:uncharacterized membrane protein